MKAPNIGHSPPITREKTSLQKELNQVIVIAKELHAYACEQFSSLGNELTKELGPLYSQPRNFIWE